MAAESEPIILYQQKEGALGHGRTDAGTIASMHYHAAMLPRPSCLLPT